MRKNKRFLPLILVMAVLTVPFAASHSQSPLDPQKPAVESKVEETKGLSGFRVQLRNAIRQARKDGDISFLESRKLMAASWSPAFCELAHDTAITELAFGQAVELPATPTGQIAVEDIDWAELIQQLIDLLLPILIQWLTGAGLF